MKTNIISHAAAWLLLLLSASCINSINNAQRFKVILDADGEDTTYCIIDTVSDSLIYDGGWNEITLDTIINGNLVFYEDFWTEEFAGRYIIYNPDNPSLLTAGYCWGCDLKPDDWKLLNGGIKKQLEVQSLDLENSNITVKIFNGSILTLDLEKR